MRAEEHVVVDRQLRIGDRRVEPDRHDDADVIRLGLRNGTLANAVEHGIRDRSLHGAHEDVRVAGVGSGVFAHHQRGGPHLHVAVEDRPDPGMPLHLITDEVGDGIAHGAVEFTDHHLRLRRAPCLVGLHERLAGPHDDLLACHENASREMMVCRIVQATLFTIGGSRVNRPCRAAGPRSAADRRCRRRSSSAGR